MSIQLLILIAWFFQSVIEAPIGILAGFRGRDILYAVMAVIAGWLLLKLSLLFPATLASQPPRKRLLLRLLALMPRLGWWVAGTMIALAVVSSSPNMWLLMLVAVGIALGLSGQDLIKNLIGGLVILADRPYRLGDRVKIGEAYGKVDRIGLQSTRLTTPDDSQVTVPNSKILSGAAWNSNSGARDCQVVTDLYLPHDTDPREALEIGYEAAYSSPYLLLEKPVIVLLEDKFHYAPHLVVRVKAHVYDHHFEPRLQSDITLRAKAEFLRRGLIGRKRRPRLAQSQGREGLVRGIYRRN